MSQFDLSNFEKPLEVQKDEKVDIPTWVERGTEATLRLYKAIVKEVKIIEERINNEKNLAIKDRKLVNRKLAVVAKVDHSIISKRRQPDIVRYIESENERLAELWKKKHRSINTSGTKLLRSELENENRRLKKEIKVLENQNLSEFAHEVLKSKFMDAQKSLARKNKELSEQNNELQEQIANLRSKLRRLEMQVVK